MSKVGAKDALEFNIEPHPDAVETRCSKSTDELEYDCNSGRIFDIENRKQTEFCDCYYVKIRDIELLKLDKMFPNKITNREHEILPKQREFVKTIMPKKIDGSYELPEKGVCVWGKSGQGKTHIIYKYLQTMVKELKRPPEIIVKTGNEMLDLWLEQYKDGRYEAKRELNDLVNCDILVLDNFDKILPITPAKEQEVFALFNKLEYSETLLYITLNLSLKEFCELFPTSNSNDYSILNRIKEQCNIVSMDFKPMVQEEMFS